MARPCAGACVTYDACAHRVVVDVAHQLEELGLTLDEHGAGARRVHRSTSVGARSEVVGPRGERGVERFREAFERRGALHDDEMHVVRHQAVGEHLGVGR